MQNSIFQYLKFDPEIESDRFLNKNYKKLILDFNAEILNKHKSCLNNQNPIEKIMNIRPELQQAFQQNLTS